MAIARSSAAISQSSPHETRPGGVKVRRQRKVRSVVIALILFASTIGLAGPAQAVSFGYFLNGAGGNPSAAITAAGGTPVALANLNNLDPQRR